MPFLFLKSLGRFVVLTGQLLLSPLRDRRHLGGTLILILALPFFLLLQLLHWLTFAVDEILFRSYRKIEIRDPVFVLGPPRSGTTHLHHVLSTDDQTTTFRTWECLFGLSVTSRKIVLGFGALDRLVGRPFGRLGSWIGHRWLSPMDEIHPLSFDDPEEDFLCLMPLAACFLLIVPFPRAAWLWRIARFDTELDLREKRALLNWYRACIQKHLYVFGTNKRFLSKNASFSGMAASLLEEFPDARILFTTRDPLATVPSQLSSLQPALKFCGFPHFDDLLRDELVGLLAHYYEHLAAVAESHPERVVMLYNDDLRDDLANAVLKGLTAVGLDASEQFRKSLQQASAASRQHRSSHQYTLEEFGLDRQLIATSFKRVYERYQFGRAETK
jgi:hypothetical protein